MKANVSLCIIVKNESLLEDCLKSIRDYVEEIVIVDTGSTDETTIQIGQKYADIWRSYTECNNLETGLIEDFSKARNYSFSLATKPWLFWCDADDIIVGGENLISITQEFEQTKDVRNLDGIAYLFPYEYSYNAEGQCTCKHFRERLFYGKDNFKFVNPVHEVAIPTPGKRITLLQRQDLVFMHRRQGGKEGGRNLRILRKYFEQYGDQDPRQIYYLGLECSANGLHDEAIQLLDKYIGVSGWDEERMMACLKLVDLYHAKGDYENGLKWALKAISIEEQWFEGYFAASKMYYFLALNGGANTRRNWERCINFATTALSTPPTQTVLFINPLDREVEIYRYLNIAYNSVGDVESALNCVNIALKKHKDANMESNKKLYERFIFTKDINALQQSGTLDVNSATLISNIINAPSQNPNEFPKAGMGNWSIPNIWDYESFPLDLTVEQMQATVIMLWKQYILHDEIMLGLKFLENAPYNVRNSPATLKAVNATKAMTAWLDDKYLSQKHNAPEDEVVGLEIGAKLPLPLNGQQGFRFDMIVEYLDPTSSDNPKSILDFGCFDGAFTNRYGLLGYKVTGIDLVRSSLATASKKAIEFNTGVTYVESYFQEVANNVPNNSFDYATSTESYEHLRDPVNDMMLPAKKILKPDGKFLLSCPHGSWFRGNYISWAHPWIWNKDGNNWLGPNPRGHLVAPDVWTLANHFREAGFWVKNSFVALSSFPDVEGQGNVFSEAHMKPPVNYPGLNIIFFVGDGVETWTPNTLKKNGMGGSETMAYEMAKRLALQGNRVRVYNSCGRWGEGIYDGVEYYQTEKYQDLECDVLIVSRRADMIDDKYNVKAKLNLLWVHDVYALCATNALLLKYDRILALSEWHKKNIMKVHNLNEKHIFVTRNGIDLNRFGDNLEKNPYKVINSSSPDCSWPVLLECWPKIKEQVPEAELHLYYGFKNWEFSAQNNPDQMALINSIKQQITSLSSQSVIYHDRVSQKELANEFLGAGIWAHPTWFTETSCITGMEAQAAGLRIITSSIAALNETVANRGILIDGLWTSEQYKNTFVDAVVSAMNKKDNSDRKELKKYAQDNFNLDMLVIDWQEMFYSLLTKIEADPLVPYQPIKEYV